MCDEDIAKSFKQRFKGIENFLRRVAFNLGNSASQTEVKIISCIPIDVTDLQQKIVNLEKELQDVKGFDKNITSGNESKREKTSEKTTAFNATVPETCLRAPEIYDSKANIDISDNSDKKSKNIFCPKQQDSDVSFVFSALSLGSCGQQTKTIGDTECAKETIQQSKRRNIFRRKRKVARQETQKPKTHFVYYAETINPLLLSRHLKSQVKPQFKKDIFSAHLSKIMRKQYDSRFGLEAFSDTSHFTRPICKDTNSPARNDSDICSCCYDRFQNIDNYMGNGVNFMVERDRSYVKSKDFNTAYYDSKFYDMVPVKELSESSEKKHQKAIPKTINNMNFHKPPRNKYQIDPITLNYRAETYRRYQTRQDVFINEPLPTKRQKYLQKKNQVYEDTSRSFSVNCGSIYTKRVLSPKSTAIQDQAMSNERENHITVNINSKDNLGKTSKSIQLEVDLLNDTKTEAMLNQIKSILQSVLTEVKTNTQSNKGETVKKDAIVQKGSSENNIPNESVNHFTCTAPNPSFYSPYSQAYMPFGRVCFDNVPCQQVKCVQNSPYYMQSYQGRCKCSCQRKNNSFFKCDTPHAITTATNTNSHTVTTEANNLIQEIYKSVALNLDYLPKNNYSSTNYDNEKSETDMKSMVDESEVLKTDKEIEALLSMCTETSSQSEEKETKETLTDNRTNQDSRESKLYHLYRLEERNNKRNDDIRKQDLEHTYGDAESRSTVVPRSLNETNKKGFLNRIAKFLRRRKVSHDDNVAEVDCETSEESETDDYETVYSGSGKGSRDNNPQPHRTIYTKKTPRINIQVNGKRIRRSPYMEQEYRRHWNEDLTFGQNELKQARDQAGTSHSVRYQQQYAPYRRNYEARSVIIHRDSSHDLARAKEKKGFLKKHKLGLRCGEHWKNLILDN
ncbi:uncharacterized protein LOC110999579 [Pieris rapae]|uniref:uncharacterized protein LOC110999579 n=1 Tax=Pieris rapae TaxID=64459 RepID=UPI001E28099D|nr:uncharacterized protein LOC110999579 [Pieris rapae]